MIRLGDLSHWTDLFSGGLDRNLLIVFGAVVFLLGALVYPLRSAGILSEGLLFASFSAFAHTLFFTLAWAYPFNSRVSAFLGAGAVTLIASGFELLQINSIRENIAGFLPAMVRAYGAQGVFDTRDLWAGVAGSVVALGLAWPIIKTRSK